MGKQAPQPGNYQGAATQSSQSTRPNVSTPFSLTSWQTGPGGQATASQQLSPEMQQMFSGLGKPMSGDEAAQSAFSGLMGAAESRLNPLFERQQSSLNQRLANQGLPSTSAASRAAQGDLRQGQSDMYSQALAEAMRQRTGAGESAFRQNLMARNMPIQDAQSMQGLLGALNYGQGADYLGAAMGQDAANLQQWLQSNAANADTAQGIMQLLSALGPLAASDSRLKENVRELGVEVLPGVPLVEWTWKAGGAKGVGVIAQQLRQVAPHLVVEMPSGYLAVDYAGLCRETPWKS